MSHSLAELMNPISGMLNQSLSCFLNMLNESVKAQSEITHFTFPGSSMPVIITAQDAPMDSP